MKENSGWVATIVDDYMFYRTPQNPKKSNELVLTFRYLEIYNVN